MIPSNTFFRHLLRRVAIPAGLALSVSGVLGLTLFSNISLTLNLFNRNVNINIGDVTINETSATEKPMLEPTHPEIVFNPIITIGLPEIVFNPQVIVDTTDTTTLENGGNNIQLTLPSPEVPPFEFSPNIDIDNTNPINLRLFPDGEVPQPQPLAPPDTFPRPETPLPSDPVGSTDVSFPDEVTNFTIQVEDSFDSFVFDSLITVPPPDPRSPFPGQMALPSDEVEPNQVKADPVPLELVESKRDKSSILPILPEQPASPPIAHDPVETPEASVTIGLILLGIGSLLQRQR